MLSISQADIEARLLFDNPWWGTDAAAVPFRDLPKREYLVPFYDLATDRSVRRAIVLLGLCTRPDTFNSFAMLSKEVRLITSAFFTRSEYEAALDALDAGAAQPRLLITDTIALDQTPVRFEALRTRGHDCKVLIAP